MDGEIAEFVEILEMILEDIPSKIKPQVENVISLLNGEINSESLMKIQDELEVISNLPNLGDYARNEIMNIVPAIELMYNS